METEDSTDRTEVGLDMNRIIGEVIFRGNVRNFDRQIAEGYRNNYRNEGYDRSRNRSREGHFLEAITTIEIGVQAIVGPGRDQEPVWIETE